MFDQQSQYISELNINEDKVVENQSNFTQVKPHSCKNIKYLCLQSYCLLNRLICKQCAYDSHRKHRKGIIDKLIEPLNRLSMNSYHQSAQDDYNSLYAKITQICTEWEKMQNIIIKNMVQLQNGILFQLSTVINTFSSEEGDKAEEAMLNTDSDKEVINQYVAKINFLNKDYLHDSQKTIKYADFIINRTNSMISKTTKKIDIILSKMQSRIKEIDFTNIESKTELVQGNVVTKASFQAQQEKISCQKKEADSDSEEEKTKSTKRAKEEKQDLLSSTPRFATNLGPQKSGFSKYKKAN